MKINQIIADHKLWLESKSKYGKHADLSGRDLRNANFRDADLRNANFRDADLRGADLRNANLQYAYLLDADLRGADLRNANLRDADLRGVDLRNADFRGANFRDAYLQDVDLQDVDLLDVDLRGATLPECTYIIYGEKYFISIANGESVRVGCQHYTVEEWRNFSRDDIRQMDGARALNFYPRLLDILDLCVGKGPRPDWLTKETN